MDHVKFISSAISVKKDQVTQTIHLLDEGNTVPFIARYRKEVTGNLDEEQIRQIQELSEKLRALDERRNTILTTIKSQDRLTPDLEEKINKAETMTQLEDIYLPYKPKRKTRASIAKEKRLEGLAYLIITQVREGKTLAEYVKPFLNEEVPTIDDALQGAMDIVAESVSDDALIRQTLREKVMQWGQLVSEERIDADDPKEVFSTYYEFSGNVNRLRPHQILAINRGEEQKVLKVSVIVPERDWQYAIAQVHRPHPRSPFADALREAITDAAVRLLLPSIERDVRRALTETAEKHAIQVFANNLTALLTQPPLRGYCIVGLDPAYRTGCKTVVIDPTGRVLTYTAIYPHQPQKKWDEAKATLKSLIKKYNANLIVIGNGTASRETEQLAAEIVRESGTDDLHYLIVNEAGASVYSASPLARKEFPDFDVSIRGAVSIARRVQDPLAELVKIDPKAIGVGMYQHDVDQKALSSSLDTVVESVVNRVGVDLNTASPALLTYVAGIGPKAADTIVAYREEKGTFSSRKELLDVSGFGPKSYEQAAGFLRVQGGKEPLDASAIHPESYKAAKKVIKISGIDLSQPMETRKEKIDKLLEKKSLDEISTECGVGEHTLKDILEQLIRPGRDPREDVQPPILRSDVLKMEDLVSGMLLQGTVRNVLDFGAFVDIGLKQDGLLHISRIPNEVELNVGDIIDVTIVSVESDRGRISLGWGEG
ncbi:MAG: RNA-binding transcriptional accessory protein [Anaerolineales bacterium]|nr:RNA-binding transcriptional accessory protein [Anaerolineales bacterium]